MIKIYTTKFLILDFYKRGNAKVISKLNISAPYIQKLYFQQLMTKMWLQVICAKPILLVKKAWS